MVNLFPRTLRLRPNTLSFDSVKPDIEYNAEYPNNSLVPDINAEKAHNKT